MTPNFPATPSPDRYRRQIRFAPLGAAGQQRLAAGRALICGCGALGSAIAGWLVRAGVGAVRIVDRDFVELSNLHRQTLFDEQDAAAGLPKAIAAAEKLRQINSTVAIEPIVADLGPENIEAFCKGVDVMLDGTDNFETRLLMNDAAVKRGMAWIYGGCVGSEAQTMTILPGETACLRCLLDTCPMPGSVPTCDSAGILGPVAGLVASLEAAEAMKILSGNRQAVRPGLMVVDAWQNQWRRVNVARLCGPPGCGACVRGEFPWLAGQAGSRTAVLCGRNAVQLSRPGPAVALEQLAQRLQGIGRLTRNPFLVRLEVAPYEITLFADGRAIIHGTDDPATARTVYAKYVGN